VADVLVEGVMRAQAALPWPRPPRRAVAAG
jgi:hypothetical protein